MQRASGQYDDLARVPRAGPRQSSSRRSFASRHRCRTAPRHSRGMEPTVRSARIESAIGSDAARSLHLSRRFPSAGWSVAVPNSVAGNGIFGCRDRRPKIHPSDHYCRQRPGTLKIGDKIPAERPLFDRRRFPQFGKTGWWCAQSYANPSPCYLANIRVIFENNSERGAKNSRNACSTGISRRSRQFDIREEQGAPSCPNTERAFRELGSGKKRILAVGGRRFGAPPQALPIAIT